MALTKIGKEGITGISNSSDANAITIDSSENVGIDNSTPSSYESGATDLVVGNTGDTGMTVASGTSSNGSIFFADGTSGGAKYEGQIRYNHGSNFMMFATGGSERLRIESDGDVRIGSGSGSNTAGPKFFGGIAGTGTNGMEMFPEGNGTDVTKMATSVDNTAGRIHLRFLNPNGIVGQITTSGSATSYATSSDHRLKENVEDMTGAIDRVKQLLPKRFNFIADDTNTLVDGFLAHEAQSVVAEAVTGTHNEVDDNDNPVMQGIDQAKLVPLLTGALKEAIAKIEVLETRVTALESE